MGLISSVFGAALGRKLDRLSTALEKAATIGEKLVSGLENLEKAVEADVAAHVAEKDAINKLLVLVGSLVGQLGEAQAIIAQYASIDPKLDELAAKLNADAEDAKGQTNAIVQTLPSSPAPVEPEPAVQ